MTKSSQFFIFGDHSWPVESFAKALPSKSGVSAWIDGKGWVLGKIESKTPLKKSQNCLSAERAMERCLKSSSVRNDSVAIVGFEDPETTHKFTEKMSQKLKNGKGRLKILQVGSRDNRSNLKRTKRTFNRAVAWSDLISVGVDTEIHLLEVQERVGTLQNLLKDSERIGILLQDDPDPDGLAGALALRKILHRNAQTAPVITFGKITRPENLAMARLLEIDVETVGCEELKSFDKIVMVDCQPSFFKGRNIKAHVILDHHPKCLNEEQEKAAEFIEVREDLGALSTLMTQYLRAAGVDFSTRLATALLYGIKSDTFLLNRESSDFDLEAFVYLYPRTNSNILRKIERPELPLKYLDCLRNSLEHIKVTRGVAILCLGDVEREDWIPQAADFALQIEGAEWALGCGVYEDKLIISARNCGYIQHCGDVIKSVFDKLGAAGGHRTMAKAIIPLKNWHAEFGKKSLDTETLAATLRKVVCRQLDQRAPEATA